MAVLLFIGSIIMVQPDMIINLNHIAILTTSLERSVGRLPSSFSVQDMEEQHKEGTREQYVSGLMDHSIFLLFIEPVQEGPYQKALDKRGAGLHHLGLSTDHLGDAMA